MKLIILFTLLLFFVGMPHHSFSKILLPKISPHWIQEHFKKTQLGQTHQLEKVAQEQPLTKIYEPYALAFTSSYTYLSNSTQRDLPTMRASSFNTALDPLEFELYTVGVKKLFSTGTILSVRYAPEQKGFESIETNISQPLLQNSFGYQLRNQTKISLQNYQISKKNSQQNLEDALFRLLSSYWQTYASYINYKNISDTKKQIYKLYLFVQRKYKLSSARPGEWAQVQSEFEKIKQAELDSKQFYLQALESLFSDLDIAIPVTTKLSNIFPYPVKETKQGSVSQMKENDLKKLHKYQIQALQTKNSKLKYANVKNSHLPNLSLNAQHRSFKRAQEDTYSVFLNLEYPLNLVSKYKERKSSFAEKNKNEILLKVALKNLKFKDKKFVENIELSYKKYRKYKKIQKLRKKAHAEIRRAYRQGRVDFDRVVGAVREWFVAQKDVQIQWVEYQLLLLQIQKFRNILDI